jgi:hypothetical protein
MRNLRLAAAALAALLAAAATGAAAPAGRWHEPLTIVPEVDLGGPAAPAIGSGGDAIAAFIAAHAPDASRRLRVKERHGLRAPWGRGVALSPVVPVVADVGGPVAAMDAAGDAIVAWRPGGAAPVRVAVRRGRRGAWRTTSVPSGPALGGFASLQFTGPQVAIGPGGAAAVLWGSQEPGGWVVRGARRPAFGAPWRESPPLALDAGAALGVLAQRGVLAVDAAGDAAAAWLVPLPSAVGGVSRCTCPSLCCAFPLGAVRVARRSGDGAWGSPETLTPTGSDVDVSVAPNGLAAVVWRERGSGDVVATPVKLAFGAPGALGWSAPETLADPGRAPAVAVNARGDALVAWGNPLDPADQASRQLTVHAAVRGSSGTWGVTGTFPTEGTGAGLGVESETQLPLLNPALDDAGRGYLTWTTGAISVGTLGHLLAGDATGWPSYRVDSAVTAPAIGPDGVALVLVAQEQRGLGAVSFDPAPDVRVTARVRGRWCPRPRAVAWTVRVLNAGRIAARGLRMWVPVPGDRGGLVASRPRASLEGGRYVWRLGRLAPGAARVVRLILRPSREDSRSTRLSVSLRAVAMPTTESSVTVPIPRRR